MPASPSPRSLLRWEVMRELAVSDFRLKYYDSALGYAWSMLSPLLMLAVFYFVFRFVLGVTTPGYLRAFEESATLGPTYRRLGELYEERGQLDKARDYYGRFVDLWKNADPELQPLVLEVGGRVARLSAEPAR